MKVVSNHPAFLYLFELLGIERLAVIQSHEDGTEADPQHIDEIVQIISDETENVTIVTTPQHSSDNAIEIAQATDSMISVLTAIPGEYHNHEGKLVYDIEAFDYISMIEYCMESLRNPVAAPESIPGFGITLLLISTCLGLGIVAYFTIKKIKMRK
jgi:ABC-type Zn uptake system ZnuABC Zn-binding protein ZnuA